MRHSWADLSKNVCICRQCGMKRVENLQRHFKTSRPVMTYTRDDMMQTSAGNCENVWPAHINPEWRASIYKEPQQAALNFDNENEPPPIDGQAIPPPRVIRQLRDAEGDLLSDFQSSWARDHDMNDDIPF